MLVASASPVFADTPPPPTRPTHEGGIALPPVNPAHPVSVATVGTGDDQWTVTTTLVAGGDTGGVHPMTSNNCNRSGTPGYCTCISTFNAGAHSASLTLQTSWNFDYSTVWGNMGQGKSSSAVFPLHWDDFSMWMSGVGTPYAYSDLQANLMDGIGWFSIQTGTMHVWQQVDAWGNCSPYMTWDSIL